MTITPALMSRIRELLVPMAKYSSIAQFKTTLNEHDCSVSIRTNPVRRQITIVLQDETPVHQKTDSKEIQRQLNLMKEARLSREAKEAKESFGPIVIQKDVSE